LGILGTMKAVRHRQAQLGRARAMELRRRYGAELRIARTSAGLPQRELARLADVSPSEVGQVERAEIEPSLDVMARLAAAAGGELVVRIYPGDGIRLRDSGQLAVAELIGAQAHHRWRRRYEVPVGRPPDRRAGDMVLEQPIEVALLEIETVLTDFQAQHRGAQLKRASLAELLGRPVRLVIVQLDTARNRAVVNAHADLIREALPKRSRQVWQAIRSGEPIAGDGLLWIRPRLLRRAAPREQHRCSRGAEGLDHAGSDQRRC
jgi:transcriptional regulator with XRE-family HTH domain